MLPLAAQQKTSVSANTLLRDAVMDTNTVLRAVSVNTLATLPSGF